MSGPHSRPSGPGPPLRGTTPSALNRSCRNGVRRPARESARSNERLSTGVVEVGYSCRHLLHDYKLGNCHRPGFGGILHPMTTLFEEMDGRGRILAGLRHLIMSL